ncbi:MAG: DUF429 domain-containing protein, partial [Rhizobacter sp.]|nr:DUF429 domain-containing protein [Rhizobacter sp.]
GVDFTSRPNARKPITVALGAVAQGVVHVERIDEHHAFAQFAAWLAAPGRWLGAFDFPFGLPRELVRSLAWPAQWLPLMRHYAGLPRAQIRDCFAAFCDARPAGRKFAHRACDGPAGSSPSMKWVNPPVAWMMHAGVPLLIDAGVHLPGLHAGDADRVAVEGYPGMLARELIGARSYKADDRARQTPQRRQARGDLLDALATGHTRLGLSLRLGDVQHAALLADATGDRLDAVLCLLQAAWAAGQPGHGLPADVDPIEGWIVSAPATPR